MQNYTELRKAPAAILDHIATILDINDDWKRFMSRIPKDLLRSDRFVPKYNSDHIRRIEEYAYSSKLSCANVLFDEWGSSGRVRPTLHTLLELLADAQMMRAADYLTNVLNKTPVPRPTNGPGAPVDVTGYLNNDITEQNIETRKLHNGSTNGTFEARCGDPTKKLDESAAPLMNFPSSQFEPNFDIIQGHSTNMIQKNPSDFIVFSKEPVSHLPSSEYPDFSALLVKQERDNSSISTMSGGSTAASESSQSPSNTIGHSETSQSSQIQTSSLANNSLFDQVDREILEESNLIKFKYVDDLETITNKFNDSPIGSGGFGDVFKGNHEKHGLLAIKRAHNMQIFKPTDLMKIFNTEVKSLSVLRHKNIVAILGYSLDGPTPCIICEYIEGGSLLENIKAKVLKKAHRMSIMIGTAEGLKHIHYTEKPKDLDDTKNPIPEELNIKPQKKYFLHGDVKSANILITKDFIPKLCDLGLSKLISKTTFHTESIVGTSAYMAPERFSGTITPKGDIYSYGIVLLELLTGLEPIVTGHESYNIKNYVEEKCPNDNITSILDPEVGDWPEAEKIYNLAKSCVEYKKNLRPTMDVICQTLHDINLNERRVFYADV